MGAEHVICDVIISTLIVATAILKLVSTATIHFYQFCVYLRGKPYMISALVIPFAVVLVTKALYAL